MHNEPICINGDGDGIFNIKINDINAVGGSVKQEQQVLCFDEEVSAAIDATEFIRVK